MEECLKPIIFVERKQIYKLFFMAATAVSLDVSLKCHCCFDSLNLKRMNDGE